MNIQTVGASHSPSRRPVIGTDEIILTVAQYYGLRRSDLISKDRSRKVTRPRHVAMYLSRQLLITPGWQTFPQVARRFGGRDHSTVIYGAREIDKLQENDGNIRVAVQELADHIARVESEAHGRFDDSGNPIVPLDYVESQRYLVLRPPNAAPVEQAEEVATLPRPKSVSVRIQDIKRLIAEYYGVKITWSTSPGIGDDIFYHQILDYLTDRIYQECWLRVRVNDENGPYEPGVDPSSGRSQLVHLARNDTIIQEDLRALWTSLMALVSATA